MQQRRAARRADREARRTAGAVEVVPRTTSAAAVVPEKRATASTAPIVAAALDLFLEETDLEVWRAIHWNDPEEIALRDAEATAVMMRMVGRPIAR